MKMYNNNFDGVNVQNDDAWLLQTKIGDYGFVLASNEGRISVACCMQPGQVAHDYGHYVMSIGEVANICTLTKARVEDGIEPDLRSMAWKFKELCYKILSENRTIWLRKDGVVVNKVPVAKFFHKGKWQ